MFDHVVTAGGVWQRGVRVGTGGVEHGGDPVVACGQGVRDAVPTPGAVQVEPVQVSDLAAGGIGHGHRGEQGRSNYDKNADD